jgi:hypothetical protein
MSARILTPRLRTVLLAGIGAAMAPAALDAQACRPPEGSNEALLLGYYAAPMVFSAQPAARLKPWAVRAGGDLTYIPQPNSSIQRTSLCFTPKEENTELSPVMPRPRVAVGLPMGFMFEGSYLPPLEVAGAKANLYSGALTYTYSMFARTGLPIRAALRAHATGGSVKGSITCARKALQWLDKSQPCWGVSPSKDTFSPNIRGAEATLATALFNGRLGVYGGGGVNVLKPRFQVGFVDGEGIVDDTRVEVDLTRTAYFTGLDWRTRGMWSATAQLYVVPQDVALFRVGASATLPGF